MSEPAKFVAYLYNSPVDIETAERGHQPQVDAATSGFVVAIQSWAKAALVGDLESASAAKVLVGQYADQLEWLGQTKAERVKFAGETGTPIVIRPHVDSKKI